MVRAQTIRPTCVIMGAPCRRQIPRCIKIPQAEYEAARATLKIVRKEP